FPHKSRAFIDGIVQGVMSSGEPILLGNVSTDPDDESSSLDLRSLVAAPLLSSERALLGALLVGNRRARSIPHRQLALLQTIAGQVALVVQNASLMAELEYQSMIQERARLAREIHDGLAQTIGFLKLQASQLRSQVQRGDLERVQQNTDTIYRTLSEAYQDARQAIDGLRISPGECGLTGWLEQTTAEFSELSGLPVDLKIEAVQIGISSEVQAQLVRILQEALSNIRKHADARRVWVKIRETAQDFILEIRDDGQGFLPEDIASASRHGLRGMQERAELVGADFQVVSRPHEGTTVSLRLPLGDLEERPE
ncbi:MAG: GAF domain-containing sensor histidine kinase, partial [Anaerolineae bacterium]|nr:GAF domain-containing sensor histidine kinase [Anaerolineae bacterium]